MMIGPVAPGIGSPGGSLFGGLLTSLFTHGGSAGQASAIGSGIASAFSHFASGGDFQAGQAFIAGDPGPNAELVVPTTPGHVFTSSETRSMAAKSEVHHHHYAVTVQVSAKKDVPIVRENANSIGVRIAAGLGAAKRNRVGL